MSIRICKIFARITNSRWLGGGIEYPRRAARRTVSRQKRVRSPLHARSLTAVTLALGAAPAAAQILRNRLRISAQARAPGETRQQSTSARTRSATSRRGRCRSSSPSISRSCICTATACMLPIPPLQPGCRACRRRSGVFSVIQKQVFPPLQYLQQRADALHAAHHLVGGGDARGRKHRPSGVARLHPHAARFCGAALSSHQARRAGDHRAARIEAGRFADPHLFVHRDKPPEPSRRPRRRQFRPRHAAAGVALDPAPPVAAATAGPLRLGCG